MLHQPQKQGLVVRPDRPWESPVLEALSNNVIHDPRTGRFRMWYNCFIRQWYDAMNMEVESQYVLFAESDDGVDWHKPALGIYEHGGSADNNICANAEGCGIGWAGVLEDPLPDFSTGEGE